MYVIFKNEDEKINSKRVDAVGIDIYAKRSGKCLERKYNKRFGNRNIRVWNSKEIFGSNKERFWRRREKVEDNKKE